MVRNISLIQDLYMHVFYYIIYSLRSLIILRFFEFQEIGFKIQGEYQNLT